MPNESLAVMTAAYTPAATALIVLAVLYIVQLLVIDVAGIRTGHVPGTPVGGTHDDPMFRAARAHANTNENFALFIAALMGAILLGADATWVNRLAWGFIAARAVHMLAYWIDQRLLRSAAFALGLATTIGLVVTALLAL